MALASFLGMNLTPTQAPDQVLNHKCDHTNDSSGTLLRIAILIPCYNEELTVAKVVCDFRHTFPLAKIYVFDNSSSDSTALRAQEAHAIVVHSPHRGKGNVVQHMFDSIDADYYIMVDGDDTYPAAHAPKLLEAALTQDLDMVVGMRMKTYEEKAFRPFHVFGNRLVAGLIRNLFKCPVKDVLSGLRVFSKDLVKGLPLRSSGFEIETELTLQAAAKGFRIGEVPVPYGARPEGSFSKLNTYRDGFLVLKSIFMVFKDYRPLHFYGLLAGLFAVGSIAAGISPILDYIDQRYVYHLPLAVLAAALGILSALFFAVGLILDTVHKFHWESTRLIQRVLRAQNESLPSKSSLHQISR